MTRWGGSFLLLHCLSYDLYLCAHAQPRCPPRLYSPRVPSAVRRDEVYTDAEHGVSRQRKPQTVC